MYFTSIICVTQMQHGAKFLRCSLREMQRSQNRYFKKQLGVLKEGAAADMIVTDYVPRTPMDASNINSHILFGMTGRSVVTTVCNGKVLMKDRELIDEEN